MFVQLLRNETGIVRAYWNLFMVVFSARVRRSPFPNPISAMPKINPKSPRIAKDVPQPAFTEFPNSITYATAPKKRYCQT